MGFDGGNSKKIYSLNWEIINIKLINILEKMNFKSGLFQNGPMPIMPLEEDVYPEFRNSDLKINYFSKEKTIFNPKTLCISIYQNEKNITLVVLQKGDFGLMYGWQVYLANPKYEKIERKIIERLDNSTRY